MADLEPGRCAICEGQAAEVLFRTSDLKLLRPEAFAVLRCRECGLCYTDPRPTPEAMNEWYPPEYFAAPPPEGVQPFLDRTTRVLLNQLGPGDGQTTVLDLGCGVGTMMRLLERRGWLTCGVDTSAYACQQARSVAQGTVVCGTLEEAGLPDASLGAAIAIDLVEHLHDPRRTLAHVCRALAPGKRALLKVPNFASWQAGLFGPWWYGLDVPRHLYHFTPDTLSALLRRSGFSEVRVRPIADWVGAALFEMSAIFRLRGAPTFGDASGGAGTGGDESGTPSPGNLYPAVPRAGKRAFRWLLRNVAYLPVALENLVGRSAYMLAAVRK